MSRRITRKEIKCRRQFTAAANALVFARNAKPVQPSQPKIKDKAEKLKEDVEILKGLARSHLKLRGTILKEDGRVIRLKGKASTGLAVIACASLIEMDSSGTGKIKLINETQGDFSEAEGIAILDTIKALRSGVDVVTSKPMASMGAILIQGSKEGAERLNSIFKKSDELKAAKIAREVRAQAAPDFFLSPEQARILGMLDKPQPQPKTNKGPKN